MVSFKGHRPLFTSTHLNVYYILCLITEKYVNFKHYIYKQRFDIANIKISILICFCVCLQIFEVVHIIKSSLF